MLDLKEDSFYYLYGRPTIEFSQTCGHDIGEAIEVQSALSEADESRLIPEVVIGGGAFCCLITCIFLCNVPGCLKNRFERTDQYLNAQLGFGIALFLASMATFIICTIDYNRWSAKGGSMHQWHEIADCLNDEISKVTMEDHTALQEAVATAYKSFICALLMWLISMPFLVVAFIAKCCKK